MRQQTRRLGGREADEDASILGREDGGEDVAGFLGRETGEGGEGSGAFVVRGGEDGDAGGFWWGLFGCAFEFGG